MSARILVIEDENRVVHAIVRGLVASGFDVVVASTGEEGCFPLPSQAFDLVILDLMVPSRDGLGILRTVRDDLDGEDYLEHDLPDGVSGRVGLWPRAESVLYFDESWSSR
jgi:two-component system response regulator MprA